jgi:XTP/dITP diphosphohydrolase
VGGDPLPDPLAAFRDDMRRLRAECAWKREQTHESLRRYLVEESWETLEAIESGDPDHLREELGDLLLQIGFHAVIAEERGEFTFDEVVQGIVDKLRRRNPHVFGSVPVTDAASVNELWQSVKATEKERSSVFEGLPPGLPALLLADKVLDRAERAGSPVAVPDSDEIGDRLLALVDEARAAGVDPEHALRDAVRRLIRPPSPA